MKPATIKALQELCDALMGMSAETVQITGLQTCFDMMHCADRLKRVLDEEPKEKEHNVTED